MRGLLRKLLTGAKTIAVERIASGADINEFVMTLGEQLPTSGILLK